jgi:hypothetical protein
MFVIHHLNQKNFHEDIVAFVEHRDNNAHLAVTKEVLQHHPHLYQPP